MLLVQSKNSTVLHKKTCESVQIIQDKNWTEWNVFEENLDQYEKQGYKFCEHCLHKELLERIKQKEIDKEKNRKRKQKLENKLQQYKNRNKLHSKRGEDIELTHPQIEVKT